MTLKWFKVVLFLFPLVVVEAASGKTTGNTTAQVSLLHQYAPMTWVENVAVRSNGQVLPITTTSSILNQLDSTTGSLTFVHNFASAGNAIQGITEVRPDLFALNVLTCNITGDLTCTPGSLSTWSVDFTSQRHRTPSPPAIHRITSFSDAGSLNGIATLGARQGIVLMADSFKGGIWSLDIYSGARELLFTDPSMNGTAEVANGINGIRVRRDALYFTNSALGTLNRIAIDPDTGAKRGEAEVIVSGLAAPDDLEIDDVAGVAYVCNGFLNQVLSINIADGESEVIAELPGPTSVRWADDWKRPLRRRRLIASTIGGLLQYVEHNITVGGAVYAIDL